MSRKFMSLMFAGVVVSSANVQAVDYSVFPVVDAFAYRSVKAVSEEIHYQVVKDILTATLYLQIDEGLPNIDVSISDLARQPKHTVNEKTVEVGE